MSSPFFERDPAGNPRDLRIEIHHWTLQEGSTAVPYQVTHRKGGMSKTSNGMEHEIRSKISTERVVEKRFIELFLY